jgi:hypothetical protein
MSSFLPPNIGQKYCVIVNKDDYHLASIISSYLSEQENYFPLFAFPKVEVFSNQDVEIGHIYEYRSKSESQEISVWIRNVLSILKDCDTVILGGLSDFQKSFIEVDPQIRIIEVDNILNIEELGTLSSKLDSLECKPEEIYLGLNTALKNGQYLVLNENAQPLQIFDQTTEKGVIVIEDLENVSTITAINYAFSINALPIIIDRPSISMNDVNEYISDWQSTGDERFLNDFKHCVYSSIEHIPFEKFQFATFFTIGIPYALVIENIIPCTHVNFGLRPDFYILHTIFAESRLPTFGSVVFSTLEFKDEETQDVIDILNTNSLHVKELLESSASCSNLDYHVKEFPYDLFHICAHGGEIQGTPMSAEVYDENGKIYSFDYDFILSLAPYPGIDKIPVTKLYFPRKLDGLTWKSKELKEKGLSAEFYGNIFEQLRDDQGSILGDPITVHNSFGINCCDFVYIGQFNIIAGFNSFPVIYNNTCWSWGEISKSFLKSGARTYIGNLWEIGNNTAVAISKKFYELVFDRTILEAFFESIQKFKGSTDYCISIVWGLHFSTIKKGVTCEKSKSRVASKLCESYLRWNNHKNSVSDTKTVEYIEYQMKWIEDQLFNYYRKEVIE